jgi:ankyrin repeat protein
MKKRAEISLVQQERLDAELLLAASVENAKEVARLLARGASPQARDSARNATPLMVAASHGAAGCVQALLPVSAPLALDLEGRSALDLAAAYGSAACARLLIPCSNARAKGLHGRTALMLAADAASPEKVAALLPVSDPLAKDQHGLSALDLAVRSANEACVRLMLPASNPMGACQNGATALMRAADGRAECLRLLLPLSDPLAKNKAGRTALMIALDHATEDGDIECARILVPASDLEAVDGDGISVAEWARCVGGEAGLDIQGLIESERERRALQAALERQEQTPRAQAADGAQPLAKGSARL